MTEPPAVLVKSSTRPGTAADFAPVDDLVRHMLASHFPSGISLAVVDREGVVYETSGGAACRVGDEVPVVAQTRYDLASLTKVVCTTTLVLGAHEDGELHLDEPVQRLLPEYPRHDTTIRHLLTHTAGLPAHVPFFATLKGRGEIEPALYAHARTGVPGSQVVYSDLGFMVLGWLVERCLGQGIDEAFATKVATPLGLSATGFNPPVGERRTTAATELDGDQRLVSGLVWGEVHDGNAFALGGIAGHAGLFAPLGDLVRFVGALLDPERGGLLSASSVALAARCGAASGDDVRGLGWRLEPSTFGAWPAPTLWHTGFTGTSLLVCLPAKVAVVLLTNAIHPRRRTEDQAEMRTALHQAIAEAVL